MTRRIELKNSDEVALVDDQDYARVSQHTWYLGKTPDSTRGPGYAIRAGWQKMSHFILGEPPEDGLWLDHANRDTLDNRRENLRWATPSQNAMNQEKCRRSRYGEPTSKYKGVSWNTEVAAWKATIYPDGEAIHLGYFDSEVAAAKAYNRAARRHFQEFAVLNDVDDPIELAPELTLTEKLGVIAQEWFERGALEAPTVEAFVHFLWDVAENLAERPTMKNFVSKQTPDTTADLKSHMVERILRRIADGHRTEYRGVVLTWMDQARTDYVRYHMAEKRNPPGILLSLEGLMDGDYGNHGPEEDGDLEWEPVDPDGETPLRLVELDFDAVDLTDRGGFLEQVVAFMQEVRLWEGREGDILETALSLEENKYDVDGLTEEDRTERLRKQNWMGTFRYNKIRCPMRFIYAGGGVVYIEYGNRVFKLRNDDVKEVGPLVFEGNQLERDVRHDDG